MFQEASTLIIMMEVLLDMILEMILEVIIEGIDLVMADHHLLEVNFKIVIDLTILVQFVKFVQS